ncbi:hypothetical protein ACJMK2_009507 [Sinanodonta woodiana]|uniref:Uncharacterized protein n=1 Tax=Sinanodonta woodiana TaxID=1069815 RepID=A0ABD3VCG5_SINWO
MEFHPGSLNNMNDVSSAVNCDDFAERETRQAFLKTCPMKERIPLIKIESYADDYGKYEGVEKKGRIVGMKTSFVDDNIEREPYLHKEKTVAEMNLERKRALLASLEKCDFRKRMVGGFRRGTVPYLTVNNTVDREERWPQTCERHYSVGDRKDEEQTAHPKQTRHTSLPCIFQARKDSFFPSISPVDEDIQEFIVTPSPSEPRRRQSLPCILQNISHSGILATGSDPKNDTQKHQSVQKPNDGKRGLVGNEIHSFFNLWETSKHTRTEHGKHGHIHPVTYGNKECRCYGIRPRTQTL